MKGPLTIDVPALGAVSGAELVAIRDSDLRLVERVAPGARVELDPGLYLASVALPTGERFSEQVEVREGEPSQIMLGPDAAMPVSEPPIRKSVGDWQVGDEVVEDFRAVTRDYNAPVYVGAEGEHWTESGRAWSLRLWSTRTGKVVRGQWGVETDEREVSGDARVVEVEITAPGPRAVVLAQFAVVGSPVWNITLPLAPPGEGSRERCRVRIRVAPGEVEPSIVLDPRDRAYAVSGYLATGRLREASRLSEDAERLLQGKVQDPIGAAVGAYALLRSGRLGDHLGWTRNLMDWFEWLPDGAIIVAAHTASEGDHEQAGRLYDEALRRGLPLFADGLSLLASHLRGRVDRAPVEQASGQGDAPRRPRPRTRASRLLALAPLAVYDRLLVTYPGSHPMRPGTSLASRQRITSRGWRVFE